MKDTTEQLAMPRSTTVNKGVELLLLEMLAVPLARTLAGDVISEMEELVVQEKPAP